MHLLHALTATVMNFITIVALLPLLLCVLFTSLHSDTTTAGREPLVKC